MNSRKILAGVMLLVGSSMVSSPASADTFGPMATSGHGGLFGFYNPFTDLGASTRDWDYTGFGGQGHVNFWLNDNWTLQLDAKGSHFWRGNVPSGFGSTGRMFAVETLVHTGWRDPDQGYVGVFGGLMSFGYSGNSNSFDQFVVGGEGAVYLDMTTIFGQGGFIDSWSEFGRTTGGNSFTNAWFVRGGARHFVGPNLKLEASGGYMQADEYGFATSSSGSFGCCTVDMPFWQALVEYKPEASNISYFASYSGYSENETADGGGDWGHTGHSFLVGFNIHFGQESLLTVDRTGASLDFFDFRMFPTAYDH